MKKILIFLMFIGVILCLGYFYYLCPISRFEFLKWGCEKGWIPSTSLNSFTDNVHQRRMIFHLFKESVRPYQNGKFPVICYSRHDVIGFPAYYVNVAIDSQRYCTYIYTQASDNERVRVLSAEVPYDMTHFPASHKIEKITLNSILNKNAVMRDVSPHDDALNSL